MIQNDGGMDVQVGKEEFQAPQFRGGFSCHCIDLQLSRKVVSE